MPLNEAGRSQATNLKALLFAPKPGVILRSGPKKSREFATGLQIPIHHSEKLRERRLGDPEGKLRHEIERGF